MAWLATLGGGLAVVELWSPGHHVHVHGDGSATHHHHGFVEAHHHGEASEEQHPHGHPDHGDDGDEPNESRTLTVGLAWHPRLAAPPALVPPEEPRRDLEVASRAALHSRAPSGTLGPRGPPRPPS